MMNKTPFKSATVALSRLLERSGLRTQLEPQLVRFRAMDPEKKKQMFTGLVFAVIAANLMLVFAPLLTSFFNMSQKVQKISSEVTLARKDIAAKDQMNKTLALAKESVSTTEGRTFKSDEAHQFLDVLSNMAKESKIKIESLTPATVKSATDELPRLLPKGYALIGFELSGRAGYHDFGHFISRLESSRSFVKIETIEIYHELADNPRVHQVKLRFLIIRRR